MKLKIGSRMASRTSKRPSPKRSKAIQIHKGAAKKTANKAAKTTRHHAAERHAKYKRKSPARTVQSKIAVPGHPEAEPSFWKETQSRHPQAQPEIEASPPEEAVAPAEVPGHIKASQIKEQRLRIHGKIKEPRVKPTPIKDDHMHNRAYIKTGVPGFDTLFEKGVPQGSSVLVCGGPGSGKTILCLQILNHAATSGRNVLYMTFEESPERLHEHMDDFGWDAHPLEKKGKLIIKKFSPFDINRQIEAMLAKAKGELMISIKPMLFPKGFEPDIVILDSLSAIASSFIGKEDTFRIYIEQLFNLLQETASTSFLISETPDVVHKLSPSGVEEFLADGVIVLYNLKHGNVRENAIEVLKMRGAQFQKKIVAMQILSKKGIVVYPEQEVFSEI